MFDEYAAVVRQLNWSDTEQVSRDTRQLLAHLAEDRDALRAAVEECRRAPQLWCMCEHYDILDKLVLHHDVESDARIRLHVFGDGRFDRPHNHRWPYAARVLSGSYEHYLYTIKPERKISMGTATPDDLQLEFVERRERGTSYFLKEHLYHSIGAEPCTISLIIRGPASKAQFTVMDRTKGEAWTQYSNSQESRSEKVEKRMTEAQYREMVRKLKEKGVI
ncbi:MAG: hypothetical protein KF823_09735 [Xanthomonadales bacterium]|nr:hypothetical protein [Xanthomonadales bacterium]